MNRPTFASILEAFGAERLARHMAAREPLHLPAPEGLDLTGLLGRDEFEEGIIDGRARRSSVKFFVGYRQLDANQTGLMVGSSLDRESLRRFMAQRTTVVATRLDWGFPHLWDFAREAEQALGDSVNLGAIVSHGGGTGIAPHYDIESLIVVQLAGAKKWQFFGTPIAQSCQPKSATKGAPRPRTKRRNPRPDEALPCLELVLEAGDLLYVPPGLHHKCDPDGDSFHFGILIEHQSGRTLMRELRDRLRPDRDFYAPMVRFIEGDQIDARAEAYKSQLMALIEASDARELLDAQLALAMRGEKFARASAEEN